MAVTVKITMFLGVTPYSLVELYCYFGRKFIYFSQNIWCHILAIVIFIGAFFNSHAVVSTVMCIATVIGVCTEYIEIM